MRRYLAVMSVVMLAVCVGSAPAVGDEMTARLPRKSSPQPKADQLKSDTQRAFDAGVMYGVQLNSDSAATRKELIKSGRVFGAFAAASTTTDNSPKHDAEDSTADTASTLSYETLANYNFSGTSGAQNISPELFLGLDKRWGIGKHQEEKKQFSILLRNGPTVAGTNAAEDSIQFAQYLTVSGSFNWALGAFFEYQDPAGDRLRAPLYVGIGFKSLDGPNGQALFQDYLRVGAAIDLPNYGGISLNYSVAQHDLTNESRAAFTRLFNTSSTSLQYWTTRVTTYLPLGKTYMLITYSVMVGPNANQMPMDSRRLLSIGIGRSYASALP